MTICLGLENIIFAVEVATADVTAENDAAANWTCLLVATSICAACAEQESEKSQSLQNITRDVLGCAMTSAQIAPESSKLPSVHLHTYDET